jgi:hypothetical protein
VQYKGSQQSTDPDDMELFTVRIEGKGAYSFELDLFAPLVKQFDQYKLMDEKENTAVPALVKKSQCKTRGSTTRNNCRPSWRWCRMRWLLLPKISAPRGPSLLPWAVVCLASALQLLRSPAGAAGP